MERGIKGLRDLHDDLVTLEVLVYEVGFSHMVTIMLMYRCFYNVTDTANPTLNRINKKACYKGVKKFPLNCSSSVYKYSHVHITTLARMLTCTVRGNLLLTGDFLYIVGGTLP